ncbi:phage tail assembly protein [Gilliamella sp. B2717]|uniref:phage tail assembly protein n=1 Tax=Gilliamella sp. B2717 TaxID=2817996 RepID=UPI0022698940|nr:phage tail assembly protein [Gilliamella sp. B2717]MCX8578810.1 phage tail assembly protein [Gilliamella sp. B2717]
MNAAQQIKLKSGLKSGKSIISELSIRKPLTGDLRGIKLVDFIELDIDSLAKVLPRITTPSIAEHEVYTLDLIDLSEITRVIAGFLSETSNSATMESPAE